MDSEKSNAGATAEAKPDCAPLGLLGCPFCGGEAELKKSWLIGWDVECKKCGATPTAGEKFHDFQGAVRRWNERAS